jgi:hypothetical protein
MRIRVTEYVREALMSAALFGSIGVAAAQQSPAHPPMSQTTEQPNAKSGSPKLGADIFVNGTLNVPDAPKDTETTPAKFSERNDRLDHLPTMARGPALTDAQKKEILDRVMADSRTPAAGVNVEPAMILPYSATMQDWPSDLAQQIPSLHGTKYVKLADKVLLVRPENRIVIGTIAR